MNIVYRKSYIQKIKPYINKNLIKVFIGQRRVGKSYIMRMVSDYIQTKITNTNTIFIDKEQYKFDTINDYHSLISYVENKLEISKKTIYLLMKYRKLQVSKKLFAIFKIKKLQTYTVQEAMPICFQEN